MEWSGVDGTGLCDGGVSVQTFVDESMDFVYLDALHSYRDAMNDIIAWYPKVRVASSLVPRRLL